MFFVAGAASGGPIAVYVYIERRKEREAESGKGSGPFRSSDVRVTRPRPAGRRPF